MRALCFDQFGGPDQLHAVDRPDPVPGPEEALVRIRAAAINPSDVKNVAGRMSQTTPPRIPGRDYAGVVEAGPADWVGAEVWGTGGDVGFTRDGTHADLLVVPVRALVRKPERLGFVAAASVGVNFLVAWLGLVEAARIGPGDCVLVIGTSGGVGGAAAQIARQHGARVVAFDRAVPPGDAPIRAIADELIAGGDDLPGRTRHVTGGRGADIVFDCVGGAAMFPTALRCLARRGRLIEISATGGATVSFDLAEFYHDEGRIFGVDSLQHDLVGSARILSRLREHFETGAFRPAPTLATYGLEQGRAAYARVAGGARGRIVLTPAR